MSSVVESLSENPRDSVNWRRHRTGCPNYRVRWFVGTNPDAGEPMYQVYCLRNTPPESFEEQEKCLSSRTECWRVAEARAAGQSPRRPIPLSDVRRANKPA